MKKLIAIALCLALALPFAGCGAEPQTLKVGASATPHAENPRRRQGYPGRGGHRARDHRVCRLRHPEHEPRERRPRRQLLPAQALHDDFNVGYDTHLVSVAAIHYEPFGIYAGRTASIDALADGATISVPNDGTNEARALMLLEAQGLITLSEDAGFDATVLDIAENPKNLNIVEMEAAQLTISLPDVDLAVINGNYALQAGLNASTDALVTEDPQQRRGADLRQHRRRQGGQRERRAHPEARRRAAKR